MSKKTSNYLELLNVKSAAEFLGVNAGTIRRWAQNAQLKGMKIGTRGDWRFRKEELLKLVQSEPNLAKTPEDISRAIKEKEKFLQHIVDAVPALIAVYNITIGEYIYVSKSIKRVLGYSPEDFINGGMAFATSIMHPDDMPRIIKENTNALESANKKRHTPDTEPIVNFEYRMKHKDGTWRWLHTDGSIFGRSADGKIEYLLNVSIDITRRKEAEEKLSMLSEKMQEDIRISEMRHSTMIEQSPLSVQILSPDGYTLQVNKAWEELWGATLEQMKGYNMLEDKQLVEQDIMPYIKKGFGGEATHIPAIKYEPQKTVADAKVPYRWVSAIIYPLKDDHGNIKEVVLVHQDITQQKDAEEQVRRSEQQLQNIMDESPAVIFLKDLEGKYLLINRKFEQLFKITRDKARGKTDYEMFPKETADQVTKHDNQVIETGKSLEIEERVPHDDGLHTYISTKFPLYDAAGKVYAVCGIATDITERKAIEERKEEFINVASHELKTPVTSVKIFTQVLKKHFAQLEDQKALDILSKMDRQINKQTVLIGDLLNLAKIQTGRFEFRKEIFEICDLIKETVDTLQGSIGKHKIMVDGQAEQTIFAFADRDRMEQVLVNLITNAVKYSPEAEKIIVHYKKKRDSVVVSVQDFGIGIPKEAQKKVFERFFRVEGVDEKTFPGFGIGLYVSAEIIKRHGGKIWVESKKDKGSTFFFSLPIKEKN